MELTVYELERRRKNFCDAMDRTHPSWDTAVIIDKVNQYYMTGTMQDGFVILKRGGSYSYYIKRSFERAKDESPLSNIYEIQSYRDAASREGRVLGETYFEAQKVSLDMVERFKKYFVISSIGYFDSVIRMVRSVKSTYEISCME